MGRSCVRVLAMLFGSLACLAVGHSRADGRVFLLDLEKGSEGEPEEGFEAATNGCVAQGARVASGAELQHAVLECAFSACSRGWLSGPSIGTTVCTSVQGSPVVVQLENVTRENEGLGVFCVKDSDAPCGQPPSFPHSHLQEKTGLELGDELIYACNQGYKLPEGQTVFSLLCDSCGEWSGHLQLCFKDDPEGHLDYEDKFTDGHLLENPSEVDHISLIPGGTEGTDREEDESTSEPEHERTITSEAEKNEEDSTVLATEPPVSQLSQKHMFWFPSEAFQEEEERSSIADSSVKSPTEDQSKAEVVIEEHDDPDYDHATDPSTDKPVSPSVGSTEDSWLDGYSVSHGDDKIGGMSTEEAGPGQKVEVETVTGHPDMEAFEDATKSPEDEETEGLIKEITNNSEDTNDDGVFHWKGEDKEFSKVTTRAEKKESVGIKDGRVVTLYEKPTVGPTEDEMEKDTYNSVKTESEVELTMTGATDQPNAFHMKPTTFKTTTSADDVVLHRQPMIYTSAYAPENINTSQKGRDPEHTATPTGMEHLDSTSVFTDDVTNMPTPLVKVSWETNDNDPFLEDFPDHDMTGILDNQSGMDHQERAGKDDCAEDPCHASGRGPMVAAIIVGMAAAVVGVVLGVWCYKKRQQKSSHYQLNGTNGQAQCIELQQTV